MTQESAQELIHPVIERGADAANSGRCTCSFPSVFLTIKVNSLSQFPTDDDASHL